ncbi:ADP-glyceromanno-heptose 6-epimerase [Tautonia plasticadhaerens]|uniref:ADP-L-glycero-D-manno-heptose-6-epimerase n=1 Tax=Tautonia plasticadhaerens TaxID=2527974 RepID=A0A518H5Q1_9BACT|nr:ADP-glyceromanno-heptose 6-epimerase [Tautonia plasticadhaerens]QDV36167.1 ADP-L-glycero-D-manno-heptose-6-epimerase [Tautonia plasticadhaerens]
MYIVTGAAGFIGSNVVHALNLRGVSDVIAVDNLQLGDKFRNLKDCQVADYLDVSEFRDRIRSGDDFGGGVRAVLHQGACADTTESDGRYMMDNNFTFSKELLRWSTGQGAALVYASSASVYGAGGVCREEAECEDPLNVYAYSKLLFDRYVQRARSTLKTTVVGLRYFNVYGPREGFKGRMASMVHQLHHQVARDGVARLFEGTDGYGPGEQRRDFVFVGDVARVNLFFADGPPRVGVFNVGTGEARSFNDIVTVLIEHLGRGRVEYIPFPDSLRGKYQSFTQADLTQLREIGYEEPFTSLEEGIRRLIDASGA